MPSAISPVPASPNRLSLSNMLPTYNEHDNLPLIVYLLSKELGKADCIADYEIIVVDDGSSDATAQIAAEHGARVLSSPYSMGNGAAIKRGARTASGDILVFMDADGQHSAEHIAALLAKLEQGYDMVVVGTDSIAMADYCKEIRRGLEGTA